MAYSSQFGSWLIAASLCAVPAIAQTTHISTVELDGHKVFVNDEDQPHLGSANTPEPTRYLKTLIYYSNTEHRWKPVPHANLEALNAARSAAADVRSFVASQPSSKEAPVKGLADPAANDPNFGKLARGHAVTTAEVETAINEAASRHGVDADLVKAIIKVESNFNPNAVSNKGAMGLMQLMPGTARKLNVSNPFDVNQNVDAGVRHFRQLLQDFNGDVSLSLAAYNAGEKAVTDHGGIPPYQETQNYVRQITRYYSGGLKLQFAPTRAPIKVYRDDQGVLTFNNVD